MATAIGTSTNIYSTLGTLTEAITGPGANLGTFTVSTATDDAVTRANDVWTSYLGNGTTISRCANAAYYYSLENFAVNLLRVRIGNIGAAQESQVAELIVEKAMAIIDYAKQNIKLYEDFCESEAKVRGANAMAILSGAVTATTTGIAAATAALDMIASDGKKQTDGGYDADYVQLKTSLATGCAMQLLAATIAQRALGAVGARTPSLGQYYLGTAQAMASAASASVRRQIERQVQNKPQCAVAAFGI